MYQGGNYKGEGSNFRLKLHDYLLQTSSHSQSSHRRTVCLQCGSARVPAGHKQNCSSEANKANKELRV